MIRKYRFIFEIALLCLLAAQSATGQEKELRKIRLSVFRIDAAMVAAKVNGYFAAEGLEPEITQTANSTDQMRGLSQGKFEIVSTAFDNVLAWSGKEGAEIIAIAQISDKTVLPLFVRPEIKDWSDLKKNLRRTQWIRRSRWCCGGFCSRTVWIWVKVITNCSRSVPPVRDWNR